MSVILVFTFLSLLNLLFALTVRSLTINFGFPETITKIMTGISPLIFILSLYPFYFINQTGIGVVVVSLLSIVFLIKNYHINKIEKISLKKSFFSACIISFIIFKYSFDALNHLSIGYIDTTQSALTAIAIIKSEYTFYQPGLALYVAPVYFIFGLSSNLNFLGSFIGILVLLHIAYIISAFNKKGSLLFLLLMPLPFFTETNRTLIGFTSNSLSFLVLTGMVAGLILCFGRNSKDNIFFCKIIFFITFLAGGITTPVLIFYLFVPLSVVVLIARFHGFDWKYSVKPITYNVIGSLFYGVETVLKPKGSSSSLPDKILENFASIGQLAILYTDKLAPPKDNNLINIFLFLLKDFFLPNAEVQGITTFLDIAGYLILVGAFSISLYFFYKKDTNLTILTWLVFYFGIITLFGIFDISFIKGRGQWYFAFTFVIMTTAFLAAKIKKPRVYHAFIVNLIIVNLVFLYFIPLIHSRYHNEEIYFQIQEIIGISDSNTPFIVNDILPQINTLFPNTLLRKTDDILAEDFLFYPTLIVLDYGGNLLESSPKRNFQFRDTKSDNLKIARNTEEKSQETNKIKNQLIEKNFILTYEDYRYQIFILSLK